MALGQVNQTRCSGHTGACGRVRPGGASSQGHSPDAAAARLTRGPECHGHAGREGQTWQGRRPQEP